MIRQWLLRSRWLPTLFVVVWLAGAGIWLVHHSEGMGGRPLVIEWAYNPAQFDPQRTSNPVAYEVFRHVCEPLFYLDEQAQPRGLLARDDYRVEDGGRRFIVPIRSGIQFHHGRTLDAIAVQASFERLKRLGKSPLINLFRDVVITVSEDEDAVIFQLQESNYEFVRLALSNPYAAIVAPLTPEEDQPFVDCTGPFQFVPNLFHPGDDALVLARFPHYHWPPAYAENRGPSHIPEIDVRFEPDKEKRFQDLIEGKACVLSLDKGQEKKSLNYLELFQAQGGLTYLGFNFQRERWRDERARQAIAMAIDKEALAKSGPFWKAETPLAPGSIGYDPSLSRYGYGFDPERSRQLLAQIDFDKDAEITLLYPESNTYRHIAADMARQLQSVGLKNIRLKEVKRSSILNERQDFDLLLFDYAWNHYVALGAFLGPGPRNLLNYPNSDISKRIMKALSVESPAQREAYVEEAQRTVLEKAIWQPLLMRRLTIAVNRRCVRGVRQLPEKAGGDLVFYDADTRVGR